MTIKDLQKMADAVPDSGKPREFRGSRETVGSLVTLLGTGNTRGILPDPGGFHPICALGFPVVVDARCPPGMLYFGAREDFERDLLGEKP